MEIIRMKKVLARTIEVSDKYAWGGVAIGGGGYVTGLVVHPKESNLVYIRTDVGGLYRWDEPNRRWIHLSGWANRSNVNLYGGESLALDPSDPEIVYAALGKYDYWTPSDIFKSVDRGHTWTRTGLSVNGKDVRMHANGSNRTAGERLAVDPNDGRTVYFGSRFDGLFRSTEGAANGSWVHVDAFPVLNNAPNGISFILCDPASGSPGQGSSRIFVGAFKSGVYVSEDAGQTWNILEGSPFRPNRGLIGADGTLYVAHGEGLAKFSGGVWTDITPPPDAGKTFGSITQDAQRPEILMTARRLDSHGNPIYRSADGGATWQQVQYSRELLVPWMPDWHWSSATSSLTIDPFNSSRVWMTDWYYAWRTDDITQIPSLWCNDAKGLETVVNVANLVSPPDGRCILHSGIADNGGFDHTSLDQYPEATYFTGKGGIKELTTTGIDIQENNPNFVVRVGTYGWNGDGRANPGNGGYSVNGGLDYTAFASLPYKGAQGGKVAVSAVSPNHIVWVPQQGAIYYTRDRGRTWNRSTGGPEKLLTGSHIFANYYQPLAADKAHGNLFYAYEKTGRFFRSDDKGATWTHIATLPSQATSWHAVQTAPGIKGEVWVSLNDQGIYRSSNSGLNFSKLSSVEQAFLFCFGKNAPGRTNPAVFVYGKVSGFKDEGIFRSDDMGATWVKISVDYPFPGNDPNAMTGDRRVYGRVYIGTNGTGILYGERV
ncbi:hypothetical protein OIN60_20330 [Paenibacillus sp. P96]|uniref:Xyloglucanase n=1 Tax=Paenibacillus zeirhizosphaerae TaxID=2987519 RepID=A0ABT9FWG9_9BACL|nr:hypothetical protein [Paenibacillus sp. P96]MDP4099078.1 hypothetical protein [Paenibacillus sp. P96]